MKKNILLFQWIVQLRNHPHHQGHEAKMFRGPFCIVYFKGSVFENVDFAGGRFFLIFFARMEQLKNRQEPFFEEF